MPAPAHPFLTGLRPSRIHLFTAVISLLAFTLLSILVFQLKLPLDYFIVLNSLHWENEQVTPIIKAITFLGNYQFLIPANLSLIFFLIYKKEKKVAGLVLFTALSSLGLKLFLKELFHRPRPAEAMISGIKNFSFPSGHALMSISFYSLLALVLLYYIPQKKLKKALFIFLILLILLIGYSRIYLRVHYTTDVIAGYCLGYSWLIFCLWLFTKPKA